MTGPACRLAGHASALLLTIVAGTATAATPADFMMQARVDGQMIEGQPLAWTKSRMLLLGRDGRLHDFDPRSAQASRKTNRRFYGYSTRQMKEQLYREFGETSELTTTQHYVVVHPQGQKSEWAQRFEDLYRSFNHYFRVRGLQPAEPPYPLIAIVFRSESDYVAYAGREGMTVLPNMLGHYSQDSNRVYLFDTRQDGGDWTLNAETIIHEATHQTAFNSGIHTRFAGTPRWLVEGLATMFEVRAVYESQSFDSRNDRINRYQLREFQKFLAHRRPSGFMAQLLASDRAFRSDVTGAYAEAWALSFFLVETRPRLYAKYLERTADRRMFTEYSAAERVADFQAIFHSDLRWFESQFLKFMKELE